MLLLAIGNGALRDLIYKKYVGDLAAHQLSTLLLIVLFTVYIGFVLKYFPPGSSIHAVVIGTLWLFLTLIFEFGFGRIRGHSWRQLLSDYNFLKGRLWILVPAWVAVAPYVFYKVRS
jgi:hypothetical protein